MTDAATQATATPATPTAPVTPPTPAPTPAAPASHNDDMVFKDQAAVDRAIGQRLEQERTKLATAHATELQKVRDEAKAEAQLELQVDRVETRTESIAKDLKFHDAKDALAAIDKKTLPVDKDGKPDDAAIKKALEDLLKAKPYLAATDGRPAPKDRPKPATGRPAEDANTGTPEKGRAAAALRSWASSGRK